LGEHDASIADDGKPVQSRAGSVASNSIPADIEGMSGSASRGALILCVLLWAIFAAIAWAAVRGKSPTMDEPSHAVTGWFNLHAQDYRLSPDVPPLWEDWIALAMGADAMRYDPTSAAYLNIRVHHNVAAAGVVPWDVQMVYRTPENDGFAIMRRARIMALACGIALAGLIGWCAWQLGGAPAAVAATFVYVWDPNFLGHAPLVKNDVAMSLAYLAGAYAVWRVGVRFNWLTASGVMLLIAAAVLVKFTGILLFGVMFVALVWRSLDSASWPILGRLVTGRFAKLAAALSLIVATCLFTYVAIWAAYDFRFDAGPGGLSLDVSSFLETLRYVQVFNVVHHPPSPAELAAWDFPASTRAILYCRTHHLLPEAWTIGAILTQSGSESRLCFLAGAFYNGGKWSYFPLAAFFKSPLATIIAVVLAAVIGLHAARRGLLRDANNRWAAIALGAGAIVYAAVIVTSNVNIGLRHAFPVYPFVFIAIGVAAGRMWRFGHAAQAMVILLAIGLAVETAAAFPNYISFFGIASGGASNGYNLLSDSNLDWGQDLPALAQWQREHPGTLLYLDYFGRADPAAYGIQYVNVEGGYQFGPPFMMPGLPGVLAVSATNLHLASAYDPPPSWYGLIKGRQPRAILDDTIYLYQIDPTHP
jgi:hypothetical protein